MNRLILNFELNGQKVLGFDTGLNSQSFAQAKMAHVITSSGIIVFPDGKTEKWQPVGVSEYLPACHNAENNLSGNAAMSTMLVWGPHFPGERLIDILNDQDRKDEALDAIRFWLRARMAVEEVPFQSPAGALIITDRSSIQGSAYPIGTVFIPPERLLKRILDAEGKEAVLEAIRYAYPGLEGKDSVSFSMGAMLYRVFCGAAPFARDDEDELKEDIRDSFFIPPSLAAPGLDPQMASLIAQCMVLSPQKRAENPMPSPEKISSFIGPPSSRPLSSWFIALGDKDLKQIRTDLEQYRKKNGLAVKTKRFVRRNTVIITAMLITMVIAALIVRGQIKHRSEMPSTMGMEPEEIVLAYYNAFGNLDHTMMDACVSGKAGKNDIETVVNLYVISRMRQAYEMAGTTFLSAEDWIEAGRPPGDMTVFGVTGLNLEMLYLDKAGGTAKIKADYTLWVPGAFIREDENNAGTSSAPETLESAPLPPESIARRDIVSLAWQKGMWRITEIEREING